MFKGVFHVFLIAFLFALRCCGEAAQYCNPTDREDTDVCIALSSFYNETASSNDLNVHMSARFKNNEGWAALGTGVIMHDSLMFVMYPTKDKKDVILSVRTTTEHYAPKKADKPPEYTVIQSSEESGLYDLQFVCHACDQWRGNGIDFTRRSRFIYAAYAGSGFSSSDEAFPMKKHSNYGVFYVNMASIRAEKSTIPEIADNGRVSTIPLSSDPEGEEEPSPAASSWLFPIHGFVLSLAFLVLMPLGAALLRAGVEGAFVLHWKIQLAAAALAIIGVALGIFKSWSHPLNIGSSFGVHKLLGGLLFLSVLAQPALGYVHHRIYLSVKGPTTPGRIHRWAGRGILIGGWINVNFGLYIAGSSLWIRILALVFTAVAVLAPIYPVIASRFVEALPFFQRSTAGYNPLDRSDDVDLQHHQ
ncbi:CBD9-like protein [Rhizodiscina lignyota]|uniref:CBD9-like protein n=1 Tax=Rhizodiscina lignyota TaxID=1504668 RepID=A0A9P4IJ89_9PEZI|nr:CBD9-like protein [Rhizodiscina lignyota]